MNEGSELLRFLAVASLAVFVADADGAEASDRKALSSLPLIRAVGLDYVGAFRVPVSHPDSDSFSYGGTGLAFNRLRNSLFLTGHVKHQKTAEISIPEILRADNVENLNTASFLQPFSDALEGKRSEINPQDPNDQRIGGSLVFEDSLIVSAYSDYDGAGTQSGSHFVRPQSLSLKGQVRGPYAVGDRVHFTSAYMAPVPRQWQSALGGTALTGNCCRSIIGYQSHGPSIAVFDPASLGENRRARATQLLSYSARSPLGPGASRKNEKFNLTTRIDGVVFPDGTRSILFIGKHGIGEYCYGEAAACGDKAMVYQGTHAYPYVYQVWGYDASEMIPRRRFTAAFRGLEPYSIWQFEIPFETDNTHGTGGAAFDSRTDRIYFSQLGADYDNRPLIHVFQVNRSNLSNQLAPDN